MTHRIARTLPLLALALGAAALPGCKGKTAEASSAPAEKPAVSVQTDAVVTIDVPRTLRLTGTLRGDRETDLAANANGRVLATSVVAWRMA